MEEKGKKEVKNYYGSFNGTIHEKSKRILIDHKFSVVESNKSLVELESGGVSVE
jgi:hypothetical protein